MTRDEIIAMAQQADPDWLLPDPEMCSDEVDSLVRFASLVAAAEREECAQIVLSNEHMFSTYQAAESLAAAIRARGKE